MNKELKELNDAMQEIKEKNGILAFERIEKYLYTLYRKIEYLIISRDNWRNKYMDLKNEKKHS